MYGDTLHGKEENITKIMTWAEKEVGVSFIERQTCINAK